MLPTVYWFQGPPGYAYSQNPWLAFSLARIFVYHVVVSFGVVPLLRVLFILNRFF